jgi:predicted Zn-dependent protease
MDPAKHQITEAVRQLIVFARARGISAEFWLHAEHSALVRFANSAVSLNTTEDALTLSVTAHRGNAVGSYEVTTDINHTEALQRAVLAADEIAQHAAPASYTRTITPLQPLPDDDAGFDVALCALTPQAVLEYMQAATRDLLGDDIQLSGMFASGGVCQAAGNTFNDTVLYHAASDANVAVVLSHAQQKWELQVTQNAGSLRDLDPAPLRAQLVLLLEQYRRAPHVQLKPGAFTVVFGADAIADLVNMCTWIGFSGGNCRRQLTFLKEAQLGQKVFSEHCTLTDDPTARATFPYAFDTHGIVRAPFPLVARGVFKAFMWNRDDADEFGAKETGHSAPNVSLVMAPGAQRVATLVDLLAMPRTTDVLYIPHLHYMNVVNNTEGIVTCCSRFGALLLRADGTVAVPFNVRMTEKVSNLFGNIAWLAAATTAVNTSGTYGRRNATAVVTPVFMQADKVSITHTNPSF